MRAIRHGIGGSFLGVQVAAYFLLRFAILIALWAVLGPVAFIFMLFGSEGVFELLESVIGSIDKVASKIADGLERVFGLEDAW